MLPSLQQRRLQRAWHYQCIGVVGGGLLDATLAPPDALQFLNALESPFVRTSPSHSASDFFLGSTT